MPERTDASRERLHRRGLVLQWFLVAYNVVEGIVAVIAGLATGSVALVSFGFDSGIEVVADGAVAWRLHRAGPEADRQERSHAERRALLVVAATFVALAGYVGFDATTALVSGDRPDSSIVGIVLSVLSLLIMPLLGLAQHRTGRSMDSAALRAAAVETWVCSYLSLALLVGLALNAAFGLWWADPAAALAMIPVVIWQAVDTYRDARS